ncbi:Z1 domain-containing protein [Streptomyces sp. NPDC056512]|uniref:Z1 domain-containing protein n=1 Tax=Streptomyces sp. NPDC056512 TaxID=3345846 RepID=UPI0036B779BA
MTQREESLYETFKLILELSQPALRLEQLGLEPDQVQALQARHAHLSRLRSPQEIQAPIATWYTGPNAKDIFWPALTQRLASATRNPLSLSSLDVTSTRIVAHLHHPREPTFATRGLVLTHPQAGTAINIAAVIAKAADRGYRMFIVLTGPHNAMRRQMQERLDQYLIAPHQSRRWLQLTTPTQDFQSPPVSPAMTLGGGSTCLLGVVKKNVTVLGKLDKWLEHSAGLLHEYPTLVIDAEVNQPSVASRSMTLRIQGMLRKLPRAGYLGYSTTALNSLLVEPKSADLFPRDFIISVPTPEHYTGPEVLFGREPRDSEPEQSDDGHDMIRLIPDDEADSLRPNSRAAAETFRLDVPPTLRDAVEYFWLVAAARAVRGSGTPHNTMLIHTSSSAAVQASYLTPLRDLCADTRTRLSSTPYITHLRQMWEREERRVPPRDFGQRSVGFDDLLPHLHGIVRNCAVMTDSHSGDDNMHAIPEIAIVVGGTPLARGRELEGVSVGYFGTAMSSAYDTLRQAERWFGVRTGYADLPRVWMASHLSTWWREIARADNEVRLLVDRVFEEGMSPRNLAVRVRSHPQMQLVREAKGGAYVPSISYGGRRVQTHCFHINAKWLRVNIEAARTLVATSATFATRVEGSAALGRHIFHDVPSSAVIDFLSTYQFHEESSGAITSLLIDYIRKRMRVADSLSQWNIAVLGKPAESDDANFTFVDGVTVGRIIRSRLRTPSDEPSDFVDIKTLMSRSDATVDLDIDAAHLTETEIRRARQEQLPHTGLLALYPIDKTSESPLARKLRAPLNAEEHVIGVGLVFPEPARADSTV